MEKITIDMTVVDLGKIGLLVLEGLYSNHTNSILTAYCNFLEKHALEIKRSVTRHSSWIFVTLFWLFPKQTVKNEMEPIYIGGTSLPPRRP